MKIKEISSKSCINKSKITDYVINPYTGCQHDCKYCYADFIRKFQNIKDEWGNFVFVKTNCLEFLDKELEKHKPGVIWISSVCDCYMPLEAKYKLTRRILEKIANSKYKNKFKIEILTKSSLAERDFDLFKKLNLELGLSINTLDSKASKIIEPLATPAGRRIETLKKAHKSGIKTYGFISPVMPGITNLEEIFRELKDAEVEYVWVELLNTKKYVRGKFIPFIKKNFPEIIGKFEYAINNPEEYYKMRKREVEELSKKYGIKVKGVVRH